MLQITLSEETARARAEGSDDDGVSELDPNEPGTSSGKRSTSKPPAPKKYKPSASASSSSASSSTNIPGILPSNPISIFISILIVISTSM